MTNSNGPRLARPSGRQFYYQAEQWAIEKHESMTTLGHKTNEKAVVVNNVENPNNGSISQPPEKQQRICNKFPTNRLMDPFRDALITRPHN